MANPHFGCDMGVGVLWIMEGNEMNWSTFLILFGLGAMFLVIRIVQVSDKKTSTSAMLGAFAAIGIPWLIICLGVALL